MEQILPGLRIGETKTLNADGEVACETILSAIKRFRVFKQYCL